MADKPKKEPKLKCPLSQEQKETIEEFADVIDKHRRIVRKITG
ncbi:hypothetical protein QUA82_24215 [Microcoleus sp. F8-D3]